MTKYQPLNTKNILNRSKYYLKIWLLMTKNSFLVTLSQKKLFFLFLLGKLIRFGFFAMFLYYIILGSGSLKDYSTNQALFFFLTFNLVDVTAQFLYREVYRFRQLLISGDMDLVLVKPMSSLFRVLAGGADVIDFITIPPLIIATLYVGSLLNPPLLHATYYILLIINGLLISTAFHILIVSLGVITLEIDHSILIFRDFTNLGKIPIDVYKQPLKGIITYLVPVGIMMTLPAKSLMGLVSFWGVMGIIVLGIIAIVLSKKVWDLALRKYTSASS